jgi:hypothetical protein
MKLSRRRVLHLAAGAAALPAMSRMASAQAYPARPVTIVVPFAAGGSSDVSTRIVGEYMARTQRRSERRPARDRADRKKATVTNARLRTAALLASQRSGSGSPSSWTADRAAAETSVRPRRFMSKCRSIRSARGECPRLAFGL